ncbi:MAG: manganese efflux pump MntP family protein [Solobacterium sp.]|jgi:putative Mn2+ efflux pump MntP|nr:manganese efflux pump MntP family protein [Solobacterium sp.]MCH4206414.1 manganese efflux pump MntP family protein [Solobacterium sp.]MCH4227920.1 manganese efflux pump MntP family protein [Solobacterium sp.]MCH4283339.1 manganese efflux pump MntP family protein [Solobacterium sp.]
MAWNYLFFINSAALGVGLAMDAFSVSLANGLNEPHMKKKRMAGIAGVFAFCQWIMPMIGWFAVHTALLYFTAAQKAIPWIALALLGTIGGKMLYEGICGCDEACTEKKVSGGTLIMQGIATSIDALSVGFTLASYDLLQAFVSSLIIAAVTFIICIGGLLLGRKFGMKLSDKASILGGTILIAIGLEIFISNIF